MEKFFGGHFLTVCRLLNLNNNTNNYINILPFLLVLFRKGCIQFIKNDNISLELKKSKAAVFNIDDNKINVYLAANRHIWRISDGSCDIEDWSKDAKNQLCIEIHYILQYTHIENGYLIL